MADRYISREAKRTPREKIKTPFAAIVVCGETKKPYYSIMYFSAGETHIGFSSYELAFVRKWLDEEFEVESTDVDVAPVRHGRWEWLGPNELVRGCMCGTCSVCKARSKYITNTALCPNCGAKMDGGGGNDI